MLKIVAALYDRMMAPVEASGLTAWRRELLEPLRGAVLEIGAGTGRNLGIYSADARPLVLAEPDRHMRAQLQQRAGGASQVAVVDAVAECLPFEDASFDNVVSTLVLCSVANPLLALQEIHRVLRPEGSFVFLEHGAATDSPRLLRWQRRIEPVWRLVAGNCHLTRDLEGVIKSAGFAVSTIERAPMTGAPPLVRPTIRGVARRT